MLDTHLLTSLINAHTAALDAALRGDVPAVERQLRISLAAATALRAAATATATKHQSINTDVAKSRVETSVDEIADATRDSAI